ncbi:hypothetical protein ALDI51_31830 [Alicycliphilus denitrificans]|uniref:hypothetical protein n=1 Tax=Alicycliphilus denitrificans TaxID=179636 RepID=UPI000ADA2817|nr:hypothetical protein [Alicycliphilus denitrificans]BCN39864.1 hypothetical protein ALDI51_31830 [Alicycliphilus denitrificans]
MKNYPKPNEVGPVSSKKGFAIFPYFEVLTETFEKSAIRSFGNYFRDHSGVAKWMVYSDYIIGDKNKKSDVIAFTFVPYLSGLSEFKRELDSQSFKDIKHLRRVNAGFLDLVRKSPTLSIAVMLNNDRRIAYAGSEKDALLRAFDGLGEMIQDWQSNEPEAPERYLSLGKDIAYIRREFAKNKLNVRLIRDIYIVASIAAYLMFEAAKIVDVEIMGWFSDRDDMLNYKSAQLGTPAIFTLAHILYHVFCEQKGIDSRNNPIFGIPEKEGKVWYDEILRIPDVICATLADLDFKTQEFSHVKFGSILDGLFVSNEKIVTLELKLLKEACTAVRRTFDRDNAGSSSATTAVE